MLFQIEEPDGRPAEDGEGIGAAIGIDLSQPHGAVAIAIGGNAELLRSRDGEPGPATRGLRDASGMFLTAPTSAALLELRVLAERTLARPVTHAVIAIPEPLDAAVRETLETAARNCALVVTRILTDAEAAKRVANASSAHASALGAALAAEDDTLALRPASL
jgi:hypothetical protein